MMKVYAISNNIYSPIAENTKDNFIAAANSKTAIKKHSNINIFPTPFWASLFNNVEREKGFSRFENLCISSIKNALQPIENLLDKNETIFILSSTKGNIELIESGNYSKEDISLFNSAKKIAKKFTFNREPLVVSNACISGVLAINIAQQLLSNGIYKHAVICGADVLSKFVISGFYALGAASNEICKPFDKNRNGINLGECAATIVLSTEENLNTFSKKIEVGKGFTTNDSNHISGPSRTGAELAFAIQKTIQENKITIDKISFVNAHGTATLFNDEMEAKAFNLCGIAQISTNSTKAITGHTLGAAGVVESILSIHSLLENKILPSPNFFEPGTTVPVNLNTQYIASEKRVALKTASGFGGCNAVTLFKIS